MKHDHEKRIRALEQGLVIAGDDGCANLIFPGRPELQALHPVDPHRKANLTIRPVAAHEGRPVPMGKDASHGA